MRRSLRTLAAVLAGVALVATLPAPCGCAPEASPSKAADEHACCAPPTGVRAAGHGCCDEAPASVQAVPSPIGPDAVAPTATVRLAEGTHAANRALARPFFVAAFSPPVIVLRV